MSLPLIALMGPTAGGKTALALALAERLPVRVISVDSAQVYRGLDLGSAKPEPEILARVPHQLLSICDPSEIYSAARFVMDARREIEQAQQAGQVPLLVGGTMLYFRALLSGLSALPQADVSIRQQLLSEADTQGWPALHAQLAMVDPVTAARLHPNDAQRIQRALEVYRQSGIPLSQWHQQQSPKAAEWTVLKVGVMPSLRVTLHERIALRFQQMMQRGFLEEVTALRARGDLHLNLPSMRAVGYRQLWQHLDGELSREQAVEAGIAATRQLARRQLTWLRKEPALHWLDAAESVPVDAVLRLWEQTVATSASRQIA